MPPFVRMRAFLACGLLLVALAALLCRLFCLQVVSHAGYERQARGFVSTLTAQKVRRGSIYDVNGVLLAASFAGAAAPSALALDWESLRRNRKKDFSVGTLLEVGALLSLSPEDVMEDLRKALAWERAERALHWLPLRLRTGPGRPRQMRIPSPKTRLLTAYMDLYEELRGRLWRQGLNFNVAHGRKYTFRDGVACAEPSSSLCREIVGIVDAYGEGMVGAEGAFNALLRGEPGLVEEQQGAVKGFLRRRLPAGVGVNPVEPCHVYLTIDTRLQKIVLDALRTEVEEQGTLLGTVLIMEPSTGRIAACATWPRRKMPEAFFGYYEPGSVFKPLVAAEALIEGKVSLNGEVLWPGGSRRHIRGRRKPVRDAHPGTNLTFEDGFIRSSNIVFSIVAERLGSSGMRRMLRRFELLKVPPVANQLWPVVSAADEARSGTSRGFKPWQGKKWGPRLRIDRQDVISLGWGNALHVTCLTLARAYAALINGGYLVEPHILSGLARGGGRYEAVPPPPRTRVIHDDRALAAMQRLLERVVTDERGTAHRLRIEGLSFGAKTGTAKKDVGGYTHTQWYTGGFIAHVPAANPRFVIIAKVDVDTTKLKKSNLYYGSWTAGPIVRRILEAMHRLRVE